VQHTAEFEALVADAKQRVGELTIAELLQWQAQGRQVRLIDVREDREWQAGHAAGAEHLGRGVLERDLIGQVPDKTETLVLYCGGGYRSALAADNAQKMGYTAVWSLAGGWKAWLAAGLPTQSL
jgi:rhodanese-related sulfurtransferase